MAPVQMHYKNIHSDFVVVVGLRARSLKNSHSSVEASQVFWYWYTCLCISFNLFSSVTFYSNTKSSSLYSNFAVLFVSCHLIWHFPCSWLIFSGYLFYSTCWPPHCDLIKAECFRNSFSLFVKRRILPNWSRACVNWKSRKFLHCFLLLLYFYLLFTS